jgi:homoserine O-acetyltransferase/O-succinyltransferase
MELSALPRPQIEWEPSGEQRPNAPRGGLELFVVDLPADLRQFGTTVRATTLGDPANPAVVVLGGISADCFPALRPDGANGWWSGLAGDGRAIDPSSHYIIGLDFAADDNGATAPSTHHQARVVAAALDTIGISAPVIIVGASYGGMVGLALAAAQPERVDRLVIVCAAAEPHPASTAARELQRRVVSLGLLSGCSDEALAIARGMAMLTYRTPQEFEGRFDGGIGEEGSLCCSAPGEYLRARGRAFSSVMSPRRFLSLSASIDRHHVRGGDVSAPCLLIGARSDQLVFPDQLERLARELAGPVELHLLDSLFGHDMFLKEAERVGGIVAPFLSDAR